MKKRNKKRRTTPPVLAGPEQYASRARQRQTSNGEELRSLEAHIQASNDDALRSGETLGLHRNARQRGNVFFVRGNSGSLLLFGGVPDTRSKKRDKGQKKKRQESTSVHPRGERPSGSAGKNASHRYRNRVNKWVCTAESPPRAGKTRRDTTA